MRVLLILSHPQHESREAHDGVSLAANLAGEPSVTLRVFLMADSVRCALRPEARHPCGGVPDALEMLAHEGVEIGVCGACMDARGVGDEDLIPGAHRASTRDLATWTAWADKILRWAHPDDAPGSPPAVVSGEAGP